MKQFREFRPGDKVRILEDRIEDWQPTHELIVATVEANHGHGRRGAGHPQTLTMTNGQVYSGWWFDPASVCHWARQPASQTIG